MNFISIMVQNFRARYTIPFTVTAINVILFIILFFGALIYAFHDGTHDAAHNIPKSIIYIRDLMIYSGLSLAIYLNYAKFTAPRFMLALALFCAYSLLFILQSPMEFIQYFYRNLLSNWVAFALFFCCITHSKEDLGYIDKSFYHLLLAVGIIGFVISLSSLDNPFQGREIGLLYSPNASASTYFLIYVVLINRFYESSSKYLYCLLSILFFALILKSGSLSVTIALLTYCGLCFVLNFNKMTLVLTGMTFGGLFFGWIAGIFDSFINRFLFVVVNRQGNAVSGRVEQLLEFVPEHSSSKQVTNSSTHEDKLLGTYNSSTHEDKLLGTYNSSTHEDKLLGTYDSVFLFVYSYVGVIGLLLFLAFMVMLWVHLFKSSNLIKPIDIFRFPRQVQQSELYFTPKAVLQFSIIFFSVIAMITNSLFNFPFNGVFAFACFLAITLASVKKG